MSFPIPSFVAARTYFRSLSIGALPLVASHQSRALGWIDVAPAPPEDAALSGAVPHPPPGDGNSEPHPVPWLVGGF